MSSQGVRHSDLNNDVGPNLYEINKLNILKTKQPPD